MGFTGPQLVDADGSEVGNDLGEFTFLFTSKLSGTDTKPTQEYKYLSGRCRHYKLDGELVLITA